MSLPYSDPRQTAPAEIGLDSMEIVLVRFGPSFPEEMFYRESQVLAEGLASRPRAPNNFVPLELLGQKVLAGSFGIPLDQQAESINIHVPIFCFSRPLPDNESKERMVRVTRICLLFAHLGRRANMITGLTRPSHDDRSVFEIAVYNWETGMRISGEDLDARRPYSPADVDIGNWPAGINTDSIRRQVALMMTTIAQINELLTGLTGSHTGVCRVLFYLMKFHWHDEPSGRVFMNAIKGQFPEVDPALFKLE